MENKEFTIEPLQEVQPGLQGFNQSTTEQELSEETKKILFEKLQKQFNSLSRRDKRRYRPYKFSNYVKAKFAQNNLNKKK